VNRRSSQRRPFERTRTEHGYIAVTTALVLVPLMIFTSFAVDLGGWYARASKMQRAADSAALAGVVWMPDLTKATSVALDDAARNGFSSAGSVTVAVSAVSGNAHRLAVTITDTKVDQYFSKVVLSSKKLVRTATAEYFLPIPLGSPTNYFGTGNLNSGTPPAENLWAAVSGYCSSKENGDLRLAGFDNAYNGSGYDCSVTGGTFANPDYQSTGYLYSIDIPASPPSSVAIQVYDAQYDGTAPDNSLKSGSVVDTTYKVLGAGNVFSPLSNPVISTLTVVSGDSSYASQWKTVGTISNPCAGCTYYLQVSTTAGQANSAGSNSYGVRTAANGVFSACSTIVGSSNPPYSSGCVQIHGYNELSLFANISGVSTFYLANVDAKYQGKKMDVSLFDLGEGASKVEILDPNGNPVAFNWTTSCANPPAPATGGCSGTNVTSLTPGVTGASQPYPRLSSSYVFNDRSIDIEVQLPANYTASYGTNTWWRVRYTVGTSATDRTTWSATILGTPVHLVG
jgi:Flp pilus assembly protein TadG